ncbi:MFS general substrate transporter [Mycena indigotica]|uniref:MFS general substrate transporter n=1 Tax=Mycena indigotica TaxID=2126181 RepID=A0A8H6W0A5_9AGAR|nr:MFS general substrate transporter [Mycena indigotica]KAF7296868.1 MFS general substrate transporter [Mycena indigotica]
MAHDPPPGLSPALELSDPIAVEEVDDVALEHESSSQNLKAAAAAEGPATKHDWKFWAIISSLSISQMLTAIEFTAVATALPVISEELHGNNYIWIGSAYTLASTALLPFCAGLAQIFGRRFVMLLSIAIFMVGSALCGAATSMNFLIAGRTVQGLGAGGIISLIQIIISDLVGLKERGIFNGIIAMAYGVGAGAGPVIGGALAQEGHWRWLFYMNLPIGGFCGALILLFVNLKVPQTPLKEKLQKLDFIGNALIVASTTSMVLALTWGGTVFAWASSKVLLPLIIGCVGLVAFVVYEAFIPKYPIIPLSLMATRTAFAGYIQNFLSALVLSAIGYWLPVYFQACKGAGPIASGVDVFGITFTVAPVSAVTGILVNRTGRYRPQMWLGWALMILGTALLGTLDEHSSRGKAIGYQILIGAGIGFAYVAAYFPVLAPIEVKYNAQALAWFFFLRQFALIWGVTIGGTILQNKLTDALPAEFLAQFPGGTQIAFTIIPSISSLSPELGGQVKHAFAEAFKLLWDVLAGLAGAGMLVSWLMKGLPLHAKVDEQWGRQDLEKSEAQGEEVEMGGV